MKPSHVVTKSAFCALCTDETPDLVQRPLGHNDSLVWICQDCDTTPARTVSGPVLGYRVPEGPRVTGRADQAFARAANAIGAPYLATKNRYVGQQVSPGFLIVRVPRRRGNVPIDGDTARDTFRGQPWFRELRHLGTDERWHIFERPDGEAAAEARREHRPDPIKALQDDIERKR
jgi:hypothetical protein